MSRDAPGVGAATGTIVAIVDGTPAPVEAVRVDASPDRYPRRMTGMSGMPLEVPEGTYWVQATLPDPVHGRRTTDAEEVVVTAGAESRVALHDDAEWPRVLGPAAPSAPVPPPPPPPPPPPAWASSDRPSPGWSAPVNSRELRTKRSRVWIIIAVSAPVIVLGIVAGLTVFRLEVSQPVSWIGPLPSTPAPAPLPAPARAPSPAPTAEDLLRMHESKLATRGIRPSESAARPLPLPAPSAPPGPSPSQSPAPSGPQVSGANEPTSAAVSIMTWLLLLIFPAIGLLFGVRRRKLPRVGARMALEHKMIVYPVGAKVYGGRAPDQGLAERPPAGATPVINRAFPATVTADEATRFVTARDAEREWLCVVPGEPNEFTKVRIEDWGETAEHAPIVILHFSSPGLDRLWQFANAHILDAARDMASAMLRAGAILSPMEAAVASYVLLRTEWSEDILRLADTMLEHDRNLPDMHAVRAEVLARLGRHEQAADALAHLGHGSNPWPLLRPGVTYAWQRAQLYVDAGDDASFPTAPLVHLAKGLRPLVTLMDARQLALVLRAPEGSAALAETVLPLFVNPEGVGRLKWRYGRIPTRLRPS